MAAYNIVQRNVYVPVNTTTTDLAGEVATKGLEVSAAVNPWEGWKFWANAACNHSRFVNFDVWTGNTPPNVAPLIINAGASYRFDHWRWPVEIGGSVRHVGPRSLPDQHGPGHIHDRRTSMRSSKSPAGTLRCRKSRPSASRSGCAT